MYLNTVLFLAKNDILIDFLLEDENASKKENAADGNFEASADGKTRVGDTEVSVKEIASIKNGEMLLRLEDGTTVKASDVEFGSSDEALLYENVLDMGLNAASANAFLRGYNGKQSAEIYALGFREAYDYGKHGVPENELSQEGFLPDLTEVQRHLAYNLGKSDADYQSVYNMGKSGVNLSYAENGKATSNLTEKQRTFAHAEGASAAAADAQKQDATNKKRANGHRGRRKGTVRGDGVTISDIKRAFNDTQGKAYKLLSTYAEVTGIDIVLFESKANEKGDFEGAQGRFNWNEDTIYIDINAGLSNIKSVNDLAKYTMLRTFSHEFTHFIEKWNPIWYNEFRKVVFDTLTERGENVNELIEAKQAQSEGMTYDEASREVVAEAMTDILPDSKFVEMLATKHRTIFEKLLDKLKEFVSNLKKYFRSIGYNPSREANALKEPIGKSVRYIESIVTLFDRIAVEAVENYQAAVAEDAVQEQSRSYLEEDYENETGDVRLSGWRYGENDGTGSAGNGAETGSGQGIRHIQGNQQGKSRKSASVSDSEGRRLSPEISESLKDSTVVDSDGRPLALYHYTSGMDFTEISVSKDVGFHSGTIAQAIGRSRGNNGRIFRNYYNIKSPLNIRADIGSWKPCVLVLRLVSEGYITESESAEIEALMIGDRVQDYNSPSAVRLREILKSHGYDGIAYPNGVEADGMAYIAFDKEQIITTEIMKYENGEILSGEKVQYQQRVNTLADDEQAAILAYKSGGSYLLNAKLREEMALSEQEQKIVDGLDKALEKLPTYKGKVYRNIQFDGVGDGEARKAFVAGHIIDDVVRYPAYTSTSTEIDGYPLDGKFVVHFEIESTNGRNMEGYGNNSESEVLFPRNTRFVIDNIVYDEKGIPTIYLTEVSNEQTTVGRGKTEGDVSRDYSGESRASNESNKAEVQRLSAQNSENIEVQSAISERNTGRGLRGESELQGVQAEVSLGEAQNQQRTSTLTSRTLLADALESTVKDEVERKRLGEYKAAIAEIEAAQEQLTELRAKIKEMSFATGPRDTKAINELRFEANKLANRISVLDGELLRLESMGAIKGVLEREKARAYEKAKQEGKEALAAYRERAEQKQKDLAALKSVYEEIEAKPNPERD